MHVQRVFNRVAFAGFFGAFLALSFVSPAGAKAQTVALHGHLAAWAQPVNDAGLAPANLPLQHLTVLLQRTPAQQQALEQLLQAQQTPGSPQYHHWLTPQQIGQRFGASQQNITAVTGWLQSQGLHVDAISNSRTRITFSGSVAAVGKALGTEFHYYNVQELVQGQMQSQRRLSINAEPQVPSSLAGVVGGFNGLSQHHLHPLVHSRILPMSALPQLSNCTGSTISTCSFFLTPADFATIYDLNPVYNAGFNGTGEKIALVARSLVQASDINWYEQYTGLPSYLPNVIIPSDGTDPGITNTGDQDEATLDVDRSFGTAQGATIDLVASGDTGANDGVDIAANYAIDNVADPILSISFGDCETDVNQATVQAWDSLMQQGAAEGISIFVSSGDAGAYGCEPNGTTPPATQSSASPNYLCSSSYVTCVGGTEFNDTANPGQYWSFNSNTNNLGSALGYIPEGAWNEPYDANSASFQLAASGGGVSAYIAKPSWQKGTGVPSDGFRDTPDIAFSSASHDGYFGCLAYAGGDCSQGQFVAFAGTSATAPSMAGVQALIDQKVAGPQGNINAQIYALAASTPSAFHDTTIATSGVTNCTAATPSLCNNSTPGPNGLTGGLAGYQLTTGYDQVTGWGSLDVANFVNAWSGSSLLFSPAVTLASSVQYASPSTQVNFSVTVSGSGKQPTGTVQFVVNGSNFGSPVTLVNGTANTPAQTFALGTYTVKAQYSGDSNYNALTSNSITLNVTNQTTPTVTLTLSASSITVGQSVTFTAVVNGSGTTPTGTIQPVVNNIYVGSPITLVNGTATATTQAFANPGNYTVTAQYSGDANYFAATSAPVTLTVNAAQTPGFSLAPPNSGLTVLPGALTGNATTVTLTNLNNFSGTVQLACSVYYASGAVSTDSPTCTLSSSSVVLSNSVASASVTATLATTAPAAGTQPMAFWQQSTGMMVAALLLLPLGAWGKSPLRKSRSGAALFGLLLLVVLGASLTGCGGSSVGSGGGGGGGNSNPGTSTGQYQVVITGTSGTLSAQTAFTLTVQ